MQSVINSLGDYEESIQRLAISLGRSKGRLKVFEAVYFGKKSPKTVSDLEAKTKLKNKEILTHGKYLHEHKLVKQVKVSSGGHRVAYEKIPFVKTHYKKLLGLAGNKEKIAKINTKRSSPFDRTAQEIKISVPVNFVNTSNISVDEIENFSKIQGVSGGARLPKELSETDFKNGIQGIISEPGEFKDWGGEQSDLFSTRVSIGGIRHAAAFAFKGPGLKTKLTISKTGKNGDQIIRLFQEPASVFFVQHWREIDPAVLKAMETFAVSKSLSTGQKIYYGIIDGKDSDRIRLAYPSNFPKV